MVGCGTSLHSVLGHLGCLVRRRIPRGGLNMGKDSKISWTTHTYNPWIGCHKVSPGCKHCYAETLVMRMGRVFSIVRRAAPATFNAPLRSEKTVNLIVARMAGNPGLVVGPDHQYV